MDLGSRGPSPAGVRVVCPGLAAEGGWTPCVLSESQNGPPGGSLTCAVDCPRGFSRRLHLRPGLPGPVATGPIPTRTPETGLASRLGVGAFSSRAHVTHFQFHGTFLQTFRIAECSRYALCEKKFRLDSMCRGFSLSHPLSEGSLGRGARGLLASCGWPQALRRHPVRLPWSMAAWSPRSRTSSWGGQGASASWSEDRAAGGGGDAAGAEDNPGQCCPRPASP